ncbi:MAG: hypothetical protein KJ072_15710 [Verrucomicrobia bacterium]|nr:hypothetical protein [Verrucomicrobiota bacterium]
MSVELVNGYVLLPHAPDWNVKPQLRREWRTSITDAVTGAEDRLSFRQLPLRGVEFQILACTLEEQRKLAARVLAAKKSGWAAVPLWGRGSVLASPASGDTVTLASETAWEWAADDYAFFSNLDPDVPDAYEVRQVTGIAATVLTLDQALARTYRHFCWPIIFGRFKCDDLRSVTSYHGSVRVSVLERDVRPEPNADFCAIILVGDGGGDTFDCYADDLTVNGLVAGSYFGGPWVDESLFIGIQDEDPFDGYIDDTSMSGLAKGLVWGGAWSDDTLYIGRVAEEDFDSYADDTDVHSLEGGSGFAGAWTDSNLG